MGLKLKLNLFHGVSHETVLWALQHCHRAHGFYLEIDVRRPRHVPDDHYDLHEVDNEWVVLDFLRGGWDWDVWRATQLCVSRELRCPGFLVYVYDGDYWGYECFKDGNKIDQFKQHVTEGTELPGNVDGDPHLIAETFPHLSPDVLAKYLVHNPRWVASRNEMSDSQVDAEFSRLNVPAQPNDQFPRFDQCAVVDFLRYLGVSVEYPVKFMSPIELSFRALRIRLKDSWKWLDWVIVGGESTQGGQCRVMDLAWAESLVSDCRRLRIACYVKQLGSKPGTTTKSGIWCPLELEDKKGGNPAEWPRKLRVRRYPTGEREI